MEQTPACDGHTDRQTDRHTAIAYSALAHRRAVKIHILIAYKADASNVTIIFKSKNVGQCPT